MRNAFSLLAQLAVVSVLAHRPGWAQDSTAAAPDTATRAAVVRNVILRSGPSTATAALFTLRPPDTLDLRADTTTNGFFPVLTPEGESGWVWSRNVHVVPRSTEAAPAAPALAARAAEAPVAATIDSAWGKPDFGPTTFTSHGASCGPTGDGGDRPTNSRKNRTDLPASYHAVTWEAVADLPFPNAPKRRDAWSPEQLAEIAPYEGVPVTVEGYLVAIKPQTGGSGESTNCHWTAAPEVDWHVAFVGRFGQGEKESVVVETTPRIRRRHAKWTTANLKPWVDADQPVRISGWLMLDPEHRNHLGKFRSTLWEIHPITKIEVFSAGQWTDLDAHP